MEDQTHFDLNSAVARWRAELEAQADLGDYVRRELETHLRDSIAAAKRAGLSDEASYRLARRRLGKWRALNGEFKKLRARPGKVSVGITASLMFAIAVIWGWSHHRQHSVQYAWTHGHVMVVADRGLMQVDIIQFKESDNTDREGDSFYQPTAGLEDRGVEYDPHRRYADTGYECLDMWKPKTGVAGTLANHGLAMWAGSVDSGLFGPSLRQREIFVPCWVLLVLALAPWLTQLLGLRLAEKVRRAALVRRLEENQTHSKLWRLKIASI